MGLIKEAVNSGGDGWAQHCNASMEAAAAWIPAFPFHLPSAPAARTPLLKQDSAKFKKKKKSHISSKISGTGN